MNRGFLQALFPERNWEELHSVLFIDKGLKSLYDAVVKHEEMNQKSRGERDE